MKEAASGVGGRRQGGVEKTGREVEKEEEGKRSFKRSRSKVKGQKCTGDQNHKCHKMASRGGQRGFLEKD